MAKKSDLVQAFIDFQTEKPTPGKRPAPSVEIVDSFALTKTEMQDYEKALEDSHPLVKSFMNTLSGPGQTIERKAFEEDPDLNNTQYHSIYKAKIRLLPDDLLKRLSIQDDLVAAIVHARASMISAFGRPQPDRFSTGFKIEPEPGLFETLSDEEKKVLQKRIAQAELKMLTCGKTSGYKDQDDLNLGQFLFMTARDAVTFGRIAVEVMWTGASKSDRKFHSFRPIDAGTIYKASPFKSQTEAVRRSALSILETIKNKRLVPEKFTNEEYSWVQVVRGRPRQAFTSDECLVHNFYPATHIELNGYPITPIDTVISAVTTHINITTHNKLYFQSGRAAKGMIVIKSDDIDKKAIGAIRQQFNASINSVSNAWRMPIFGVGVDDDITWMPIDNSSRDMEFQYLSDSNARVILSAFQMSPEELPGYTHLCLSPDTPVWTHRGVSTIGDILQDKSEVGGFSVWTGSGWSEARAFFTGEREVRKTVTDNGLSLTTSPEHRFRVVDEAGELTWRQQKDLKVGDTVLVNRHPTPGFIDNVPSYKGQRLSLEMAEILGWLTGDGSVQVSKRGKTKHSKSLEFYYHHDKEPQLRERHFDILQKFGLEPKMRDRHLTELQVEKQKSTCGFQSVSSVRRSICLYNTEFVEWLLSLGFKPSTEDKAIPPFLHGLPVEYRGAFLRGFFSADGSRDVLNTPSITICSPKTREQTKLLLLSMGIRTRFCEGTTKTAFKKLENGNFKQHHVKGATRLIVKDKHEFYQRIGFLQPHKQPNMEELAGSSRRWDRVARSVAIAACDRLLATDLVVGHEARDRVRHALKDSLTPYREIDNVRSVLGAYGHELPAWTRDFYQESVVAIETSDEKMDMVDIEVFDDVHAFMANGVVVHNSRGTNSQALSESSNEYKLQAHRDVGFRPLMAAFQNFINNKILPLIDEDLSKVAAFKFVGIDAETAEKEAARIGAGINIYETMDSVLESVERKPIGEGLGGKIILNPSWQNAVSPYLHVGYIREHVFGVKGAAQDPEFAYVRDPMWFQWQQLLMQQQQMQQQAQAQAAQGGQPGQAQQAPMQGEPAPGQQQAQSDGSNQPAGGSEQPDLTSSLDQASDSLTKGELQLTTPKRKLIEDQRKVIAHFLQGFESDSKQAISEILRAVKPSAKIK